MVPCTLLNAENPSELSPSPVEQWQGAMVNGIINCCVEFLALGKVRVASSSSPAWQKLPPLERLTLTGWSQGTNPLPTMSALALALKKSCLNTPLLPPLELKGAKFAILSKIPVESDNATVPAESTAFLLCFVCQRLLRLRSEANQNTPLPSSVQLGLIWRGNKKTSDKHPEKGEKGGQEGGDL